MGQTGIVIAIEPFRASSTNKTQGMGHFLYVKACITCKTLEG